jgi:hypothetical protein
MKPNPPIRWGLSPAEEAQAFEALKPRLAQLWAEVFPKDDEPYTSVIVPSVTLDDGDPVPLGARRFYEETLLFLLMRLRNPQARVVYLTSQPIPSFVMDYYLHFLAGIPASHAAARLTLLSVHDASPRPLTEKILERPRLLERIRAAIPDLARAYMTVFRASPLERRLATLLDIPLNAADPELESLCAKSSGRRVMQEAGVEVPLGFEDLRDEDDLVAALQGLSSTCPRAPPARPCNRRCADCAAAKSMRKAPPSWSASAPSEEWRRSSSRAWRRWSAARSASTRGARSS